MARLWKRNPNPTGAYTGAYATPYQCTYLCKLLCTSACTGSERALTCKNAYQHKGKPTGCGGRLSGRYRARLQSQTLAITWASRRSHTATALWLSLIRATAFRVTIVTFGIGVGR